MVASREPQVASQCAPWASAMMFWQAGDSRVWFCARHFMPSPPPSGWSSAISVLIFLCVVLIAFLFIKGFGAAAPGGLGEN